MHDDGWTGTSGWAPFWSQQSQHWSLQAAPHFSLSPSRKVKGLAEGNTLFFWLKGCFPTRKRERERESECCQLWIDQPPQGEQVLRWEVLETTLPLYLGDDLMMYVWTSVQSVGLIGKRRRRKLNGETAVHLMWDGKLSLMGWFGKGKGTFAGWKRCKKQWRPFNSWAWLIGEVPLLIKRR